VNRIAISPRTIWASQSPANDSTGPSPPFGRTDVDVLALNISCLFQSLAECAQTARGQRDWQLARLGALENPASVNASLAVGIGGFCSASNMGLAIISVAQCLQPGSCLPSEQAIGFGTQAASGARSAIRAQVAHPTQATPPPPEKRRLPYAPCGPVCGPGRNALLTPHRIGPLALMAALFPTQVADYLMREIDRTTSGAMPLKDQRSVRAHRTA
jgi:hypothetical protein